MNIRQFRMEDFAAVLQLWKSSGLIVRPGDDLEGIKIKQQRDPDLFLVAESDGKIVGTVMGAWDGRRGWINHLAVKPSHQRKGIGSTLVREVEKRLIEKGAQKVNAQIYRWNTRSIDFFRAIGYEVHSDLVMIGKYLKK